MSLTKKTQKSPIVLGIESSCDETGIGIVQGKDLLANAVSSSMEEHARFGGVIPEIAARAHLDTLLPTIEKALKDAKLNLNDIDAVAVTSGPGLAGALMVGVSAAKSLAYALNKPLYAVNHLVAHIGAGLLDSSHQGFTPASELVTLSKENSHKIIGALLTSGGHTEILKVNNLTEDVQLLGATFDDAAGEAYDKVARILGLSYPGGPAIDALHQEYMQKNPEPDYIRFPRALTLPKYMGTAQEPGPARYDFSFSGLKTAVVRYIEEQKTLGHTLDVPRIAASFQEAVVDVLSKKAVLACVDHDIDTLMLGGGVAANNYLRTVLLERTEAANIDLITPELSLCTDNGAMIAALGAQLMKAGASPSGYNFSVTPSLSVETIQQQ